MPLLDLILTPPLLLRVLLYAGTVLSVGSLALRLTLAPMPGDGFSRALNLQAGLGAGAVLVAALGLVMAFLLSIAGGDLSLALSPDFLLLGLQMPVGQANLVRIFGLVLILWALAGRGRWRGGVLAAIGAGLLVLSFGLEGHSLSFGPRWLTGPLVLLHVAIVSWWLAVILPLLAAPRRDRDRYAKAFGGQAVLAVPVLLVAGSVLLGQFTGWRLDLSQDYQRQMLVKLVAVAAILAIAAGNKLWLTGRSGLVWALRVEALVAAGLLVLTALLTATGPEM